MKKITFIILLFISFFAITLKANAIVPLCIYSGDTAITHSSRGAYILIENNKLTVHMESRLGIIGDLADSFGPYRFTDNLPGSWIPIIGVLRTDTSNNIANIFAGTKTYALIQDGDGAIEQYEVVDEDADVFDVDWSDDSLKDNLYNYGYCPNALIEDADSGIFDYPTIGFSDSAEYDGGGGISGWFRERFHDIKDGVDEIAFQNRTYYLQYAMFTPDAPVSVSEVSTCLTNNDTIDKYTMLFTLSDVFSETEKGYLMNLYEKNGYNDIADKIIELYGPESSCATSNSSYADKYNEMYTAASNYRNVSSGEMETGDITCDGIIGDPSEKGSFAYYLNRTIKFIQFVGPILVIIFTIVEYFKALTSGDADSLKKANKRTVTRLIFAVLLFLIPALINTLLNIFNIYSDCSIITNI